MIQENRIEEKFFLPRQLIHEFLALINVLNAIKKYPDRKVKSLYLDHDNICYSDHIEGLFDRKKIRFRWYNNDYKNTVLEYKKKTSIFTLKNKFKVSNFNPYHQNLQNLARENNFWEISALLPSCYIFYDRSYYNFLNQNIRLTIDTNINFGKSNSLIKKLDINYYIVEIKYSPLDDITKIYKILNKLDISLSKISKYIICKERI